VNALFCAGCGERVGPSEPYPFRCPNAGKGDDVDHVLRPELDYASARFPPDEAEVNPFVRYRSLLHAHGLGLPDEDFCSLVRSLDRSVASVSGVGFAVTPFARSDELSDALGFSAAGGVWIKDETRNVSGSHKARHLFGVLLQLETAERLGLADSTRRPDLAIASCGNAALAAAVVAAAGRRVLRVFVPAGADPAVLDRLRELGAVVTVCRRTREAGDPAYRGLLQALEEGALPFTCQGNLNGLAGEGGKTLGYELVSAGAEIDRLIVQVGGGALASACAEALQDAVALGVLPRPPRVDTVQTRGAWPLKRAFDRVVERGGTDQALRYAARHRSEFMWPWEQEPRSIAHGILDDETYDWLAVVEGMLATGGAPVVVGERTLMRANDLARETTGIDVDHTGSSGLAGLLALRTEGDISDDERVAVLFTGVVRPSQPREGNGDEELHRQGHPVAQRV
jgi:threonine synthase